jgi:hypothetical protein
VGFGWGFGWGFASVFAEVRVSFWWVGVTWSGSALGSGSVVGFAEGKFGETRFLAAGAAFSGYSVSTAGRSRLYFGLWIRLSEPYQ